MTTIKTRLGAIRGLDRGGMLSFLGIPFAAPPVGALRWRPPAPAAPWRGTYDATRPPNRAFQPPLPESLNVGPIAGAMSEDMLYLNIHTPAADKARRPVFVWIHGGGFVQGSANDFDPAAYARQYDLCFVAINYRVGMLGFLDLSRFGPDYAGSAANGFRDQIAALRWIADNIADYGGDPENVTICGGSAGAGSVLALQAAPSARGLFHKAIAVSPSDIAVQPPNVVTPYAAGLSMTEDAFLDMLKTLPAEGIFDLQVKSGMGGLAAVDGVVIVARPTEGIRAGVNPTPTVVGSTAAEGPLLTAALGSEPSTLRFFEAGLATMIAADDPARYGAYLDTVAAGASPAERMDRVWTDFFRSTTLRAAEAAEAVGVPFWVYSWAAPTPHPFGPTHGSDVAFVFNLFDPGKGDGGPRALYPNTPENRELAQNWSATFAAFVRSGAPAWPGTNPWPIYSRATRRTLVIDPAPRVVENLDPPAALAAFGL
ncbi:MAG: carboxylesterase family protein [Alphaproteobacteria bacterium]|nr:carboxylesterase family protein [Alphaproteobacteria bacterium]